MRVNPNHRVSPAPATWSGRVILPGTNPRSNARMYAPSLQLDAGELAPDRLSYGDPNGNGPTGSSISGIMKHNPATAGC